MKKPFGNRNSFWIGLQDLHRKCNKSNQCDLIIQGFINLEQNTIDGSYMVAENFYIGNENDLYRLYFDEILTYQKGSSQFIKHKGMPFQTKDKDIKGNVEAHGAPFWFSIDQQEQFCNPLAQFLEGNIQTGSYITNTSCDFGIEGYFNSEKVQTLLLQDQVVFMFRHKCIGAVGQKFSRLPEKNCKCPEGYYDVTPNDINCQPCLPHCLECQNQTECLIYKYKAVRNQNGKFQLSNGDTHYSCRDYLFYMGFENSQGGIYEEKGNPKSLMYCRFDPVEYYRKGEALELEKQGYQMIFRRFKNSNQRDYNKSWYEMKQPFGDENEYWMGLEDLHEKCGQANRCDLYIFAIFSNLVQPNNVQHFENNNRGFYLKIENFYIEDEENQFKMHLDMVSVTNVPYVTNPNLFFNHHDGQKFSTFDQNNDNTGEDQDCVDRFSSPFWYNACFTCNPLQGFLYNTEDAETQFDNVACCSFGFDYEPKAGLNINCFPVEEISFGFTQKQSGPSNYKQSLNVNNQCPQGYGIDILKGVECQKCQIQFCQICDEINICTCNQGFQMIQKFLNDSIQGLESLIPKKSDSRRFDSNDSDDSLLYLYKFIGNY